MRPEVEAAARAVEQGGVIVYPTDTLWGLGASIDGEAAVGRVFELKRRPATEPLSIAVASPEAISDYAVVNATARRLFPLLPGPVTLVLPKRDSVPDRVTGGRDHVGVRVPAHPDCLDLLQLAGPLTSTSANLHGAPDARSLDEARSSFGERVDYYLDSHTRLLGAASTIVDCRAEGVRVLRAGAIRESRIRELLD